MEGTDGQQMLPLGPSVYSRPARPDRERDGLLALLRSLIAHAPSRLTACDLGGPTVTYHAY